MSQKIFHLQPWAPATTRVAHDIIDKVHSVAPELEVLFMGAAALGMPGKNDIDLDVLCDIDSLPFYTQKLTTVLGRPHDADENLTIWNFEREGLEVDIILSDPALSHVPLQRAVLEKLKASPELLYEYAQLKKSCDGLPLDEYERRKKIFFEDRVLPAMKT